MSDSPPELEELKDHLNLETQKDSLKKTSHSPESPNTLQQTQKLTSENNNNVSSNISNKFHRRNSEKKPRLKNYNLSSDRSTKKNWVTSTKEAIELNHTMKEFQWKFGLFLNEKINVLNQELKNLKEKIEEQKIKNFN